MPLVIEILCHFDGKLVIFWIQVEYAELISSCVVTTVQLVVGADRPDPVFKRSTRPSHFQDETLRGAPMLNEKYGPTIHLHFFEKV